MASEFKVGNIVYSTNNAPHMLYCIYRIQADSKIGVLSLTGTYPYVGTYAPIFVKVYSTKKRKNLFLEAFKKLLLEKKSVNAGEFTNLDYMEVVAALKNGSKKLK